MRQQKPIELCAKVIEKKLCSFFRSAIADGERNRIENGRENVWIKIENEAKP